MQAFTNKLINETSPYLLQHAHNPVNWYPWSEEALQKAREEDKPILVSIGYSACHWCHVMERESFENEQTASLMNELFINIKIDREERPDLDQIYMDAVQMISGSGGWPLNVFLTPDRKPFYGGTYFPPQRAYNRSSWKEILIGVSQLFKEKREQVDSQSEELTRHIESSNFQSLNRLTLPSTDELFSKEQLDTIFENIMRQADKSWGGFGNAPKFPQTFTINYLLKYYHYTKNEVAITHAALSLDKMLQGGIYDQIGGGFSRYSTDTEWLAPHFEKMLYDNALLIASLCEGYQITKNTVYKDIVSQTIDFIERELMNKEGGFYAALDADSQGEEGKYYVWEYEEVQNILGSEGELFCEYYDVTRQGNWENKNILRVLIPLPDFAIQKNVAIKKLKSDLKASCEKLLKQRESRIRPALDDKILLGWNALMITSLCKAAAALGDERYKEIAIKTFDFLFSKCKVKENEFAFFHTYKNGEGKYAAFLDDYAFLIQACISLQEITSDQKYIDYAFSLTGYVMENFASPDQDYFYYTGTNQKDVIVRKKEIYDGALPSGNSVMAGNLLYLSIVFNKSEWKQMAVSELKNLLDMIIKYPTSFAGWAALLLDEFAGIFEIAVVGKDFENLRDQLMGHFIPNKVIQSTGDNTKDKYLLLANKSMASGGVIYLCRGYSCRTPKDNVAAILTEIVNNTKFN